jgi:hypothetical protein
MGRLFCQTCIKPSHPTRSGNDFCPVGSTKRRFRATTVWRPRRGCNHVATKTLPRAARLGHLISSYCTKCNKVILDLLACGRRRTPHQYDENAIRRLAAKISDMPSLLASAQTRRNAIGIGATANQAFHRQRSNVSGGDSDRGLGITACLILQQRSRVVVRLTKPKRSPS